MNRLRLETYGLNGITGKPVIHPVRHHIYYDKSQSADRYLLYVDQITNRRIRDPAVQRYLGQPITHTPESLEDMYMCEQAKNAFLRGQPNPLWLDHTSSYYRPRSTREYYWRKFQVGLYGIQWLDSPQASNPAPPTFMPYLNMGPL